MLNIQLDLETVGFSIEGCVLRGGECSGPAWSVDDFPEV